LGFYFLASPLQLNKKSDRPCQEAIACLGSGGSPALND
jgi:hypothetical protein